MTCILIVYFGKVYRMTLKSPIWSIAQDSELTRNGFTTIRSVISPVMVGRLRETTLEVVAIERDDPHVPDEEYGRVLFCPKYGGVYFDLLADDSFMSPFDVILGDDCILYTMTSSCIPPQDTNHTHRIHVDTSRFIPGYPTMLAAIVMLDDFTVNNGATSFLPGSHLDRDKPNESTFDRRSVQITGKAGDVCYFDPRCWHRSEPNLSQQWRCSQLLGMIKPWIKQRFDLGGILADTDLSHCSDRVLRRLGFHSLPPRSYAEYAQRAKDRMKGATKPGAKA